MALVGGNPEVLDGAANSLWAAATDLDGAATGISEKCASAAWAASSVTVADAINSFRLALAPAVGAAGANLRTMAEIAAVQAHQLRLAGGIPSVPLGFGAPPPLQFPVSAGPAGPASGAVTGPQGDPEVLRHAGNALCHLAEQVRSTADQASQAIESALAGWQSVRAEMYVSAGMLPMLAASVGSAELQASGIALKEYANQVEETLAVFAPRCTPDVPDPYQDLKERDSLELLADAESRVAVALYSSAGLMTVPQASPTPTELLTYIESVGNAALEHEETYSTARALGTFVSLPSQLAAGRSASEAWHIMRSAVGDVIKRAPLYQAITEATEKVFGKDGSETFRVWSATNASMSEDLSKALGATKVAKAARADFLKAVVPAGKVGRFLPVIDAVSDFRTLWDPDHDGARGTADRVAAIAGLTATALGIVAATTVVTLGTIAGAPAIGVAILVLGVGSAGWQLGSVLYDNRAEIRAEANAVVVKPYVAATELFEDCGKGVVQCGHAVEKHKNNLEKGLDLLKGDWRVWG